MVKVKICGLTRKEDADFAILQGASALGFIFIPESKRYNSVSSRKWIGEISYPIQKVGVFADQSADEINSIYKELKLNIIQLHGKEDEIFIESLKLPVWKSITIDQAVSGNYPEHNLIEKYLIDSESKGKSGGTGISFDWNLLEKINLPKPFIAAGGLNPENISGLLKFKGVEYIDVNSGVEDSPGIKSQQKIKKLFSIIEISK